jgi:hypothetical protein
MINNKIYFTGQEVMDRWGIGPYDLKEYLIKTFKDEDWFAKGVGFLQPIDPFTSTALLRESYELPDKPNNPRGRWTQAEVEASMARKARQEDIEASAIVFREPSEVKDLSVFSFSDGAVGVTIEIYIGSVLFFVRHILAFEKQHGLALVGEPEGESIESLSGEERRELGFLRQEKAKWKSAIKAAVHAGVFAARKGKDVKRKELEDEFYKLKFDVPSTTFELIHKALRDEGLTKKGGRPPKKDRTP